MTPAGAKELVSRPDRWPQLTAAELEELIKAACWLAGTTDAAPFKAAVGQLYEHVIGTLPPETRRQIASDLGGTLEEHARTHGTCPVRVLHHWLLTDPHPDVVSTAALACAQVMKATEEDPLRGPRTVLDIAAASADQNRQAAIVSGLAATGDGRVLSLIAGAWERLAKEAQLAILENMGAQAPTMAGIEFLVSRLEQAVENGTEWLAGAVVPSLVRLSHAACGVDEASPFAGSWVQDLHRIFPSWSVPADADVVTLHAVYPVGHVGHLFRPRLSRLAARESYPRLIPLALRAYGLEDAPFVDAVRQAVAASGRATGRCGLLEEPMAIEPHADWERPDAVLVWGLLSPFGPTQVRLCVVRIDDDRGALVYSRHHPFGPVCLLLGVTADADVPDMLLELADRSQAGGPPLLQGLPHWVWMPAGPNQLSPTGLATFFMQLHRTALARDLAIDDDIDEVIAGLDRLRRDPQAEVRRQFAQAVALAGAAAADARTNLEAAAAARSREMRERCAPASDEMYRRWLSAASAPGHVADVSIHFTGCWGAAERLQRHGAQGGGTNVLSGLAAH